MFCIALGVFIRRNMVLVSCKIVLWQVITDPKPDTDETINIRASTVEDNISLFILFGFKRHIMV